MQTNIRHGAKKHVQPVKDSGKFTCVALKNGIPFTKQGGKVRAFEFLHSIEQCFSSNF